MYCRKCGNPIKETDIRCKVCGASPEGDVSRDTQPDQNTGSQDSAAVETGTEEKSPVHFTEFTWNVYDFPKPKKTEELDLQWSRQEEAAAKTAQADREREQALQGDVRQKEALEKEESSAEKKRDIEDIEPEILEVAVPLTMISQETAPEKKAEAEAAREESVKEIEKFFTFTKKNEEFQMLLDKEYEKLLTRRDGEPYIEPELSYSGNTSYAKPDVSDAQSELERMILEGTTPVEEAVPLEDLLQRRTIPVDLAKIQREAQKAEEVPSIELPKKSVEDIITGYQTAAGLLNDTEYVETSEVEPEPATKRTLEDSAAALADQLSEMAAARDSFFRQLDIEKEALRKAEEEAARRVQLEQELRAAEKRPEMTVNRMLTGANAEIQVTVAVKANGGMSPQDMVSVVHSAPISAAEPYESQPMDTETHRSSVQKSSSDMQAANGSAYTHVIDAEAVEVEEKGISRSKVRTSEEGQNIAPERTEKPTATAEQSEEPWHENTLNNLFPVEQATSPPQEEEEERRGGAAKVILIIIAAVLIIEIIALGIKYFAPESAAADAVKGTEVKIVEVFNGAVDGVTDFFKGLSGGEEDPALGGEQDGTGSAGDAAGSGGKDVADQDGDNPGSANGAVTAPDSKPMADKSALIATQISHNKNIKEVTASDDLTYKDGRNYGVKDINHSKPIANNIWKTLDSGEVLYYDRAVVGTLIAFDSQWQDYVNNGTKDVLSLTKEGSKAYQNAATYSKVGKEIQSFESLQIGEIRQGSNGFYVWTKEQIKKTRNGKNSTVTYYWIYQLEPIENEMKIVNCIAY